MTNMTERPLCPDPEALAAFADGTATEAERERIREHLATCNDCLEEVAEVSRFAALETPANVVPLRPASGGVGRGGWLAAAAAVVVALAGLAVWRTMVRDPLDGLRAAVRKADDRVVEGRLYKFPFADQQTMRGNGQENDPGIDSAAAAVLFDAGDQPKGRMKRAAAVARLIQSARKEDIALSIAELEQLAGEKHDDAGIWNDLAVARLKAGDYRGALQAAGRARKLDPKSREAWFNYALALQSLDPSAAKAEWQRYIATETNPDWKKEAQDKLELAIDLQ